MSSPPNPWGPDFRAFMGSRSISGYTVSGDKMNRVREAIRNFCSEEDGAALVEYAVLLVLVAIACVIAAAFMGQRISVMFMNAQNQVKGA